MLSVFGRRYFWGRSCAVHIHRKLLLLLPMVVAVAELSP
jgi:hypothetical protein